MNHVHVSQSGNSTDTASSDDSEAALYFFLGLIIIWTSIIVLSFCVARCDYMQSTAESSHNGEKTVDQIITERAVSLLGGLDAVTDVEAGCEISIHNKDAPECSICLTPFQENDIVSWSQNRGCRHAFHHACILPWLMKDRKCPCCRQPFLGISSDRASTSFFSVQLGLVDTDKTKPEQTCRFQPFLKSSELTTSHPLRTPRNKHPENKH